MSERGFPLPGAPDQTPDLPAHFIPIVFERFENLNTKAGRPAAKDTEYTWCHGWMPIADNTLRTLYGKGPALLSDATIVWFAFGNISDTRYCVYLKLDGSLIYWNITAGSGGAILSAGSIINPRTVFGYTQWGSQFLIFASDQPNGYWIWDGAHTYTAGTVSPLVNVTNSGESYTSQPTFTLQTTGSGGGCSFNATIINTSVSLVNVTNPGSGFGTDDFAILTVSGGGSDNQAVATATLSAGGGVQQVVVTDPGNGYTFNAKLAFTGGGGSGAAGILNIQNGQIQSVTIVALGNNYTSAPTPVVTDAGYGSGASAIAGGSGFAGFSVVGQNGIASIGVSSAGSNYTSVPTVTIIGDGTGATAVASISGGALIGITVTNPGQGYSVALVAVTRGNNAANVTISLMPFGISGTTLEVNQQIVWIGNGAAVSSSPPKNRVIFSDPENPASFGNGGGAFPATDSFVKVGYHSLKQTNGFLYLIGDSSINYISGVQTTSAPATSTTPAGPPITTFGNQNVDPQIGSPWPSSVQVFSRNIMFANTTGIYISYGGAVTKVSEPTDGFYTTGNIFGVSADFPAAVATIFGISCYMLMLPIVDQVTQAPITALILWTGKKWFTCLPDISLTYIATQEINSVLTAWGTDGISIVPLFQQPSNGITKTIQSKLFSSPAYWTTKATLNVTLVSKEIVADAQTITMTIDNEVAQGSGNALVSAQPIGNANADVIGPIPCGQAGRMVGVTLQTTAGDSELYSVTISAQVAATNI